MYWIRNIALLLVPPTLQQQPPAVITGTVSRLLQTNEPSFKYRGRRNRTIKMQFSSDGVVYELGDGEPPGKSNGNSVPVDEDSTCCDDGGASPGETEASVDAVDLLIQTVLAHVEMDLDEQAINNRLDDDTDMDSDHQRTNSDSNSDSDDDTSGTSSTSSDSDSTSSSDSSGSDESMPLWPKDLSDDEDEVNLERLNTNGELLQVITNTRVLNTHRVAKASQLHLVLVEFKTDDPKRFRRNLRVSPETFDELVFRRIWGFDVSQGAETGVIHQSRDIPFRPPPFSRAAITSHHSSSSSSPAPPVAAGTA
ncbi:hypothetical protein C8R47DRAFT_1202321, partial [Mycena vitilis]